MHGSGEGHTAYFYKRVPLQASVKRQNQPNQKKLTIPVRGSLSLLFADDDGNTKEEDKEEIVSCDAIFYEASKLAMASDMRKLKAHTEKVPQSLIPSPPH